jgi:SPP1 family predicted phage head-tail adaptor
VTASKRDRRVTVERRATGAPDAYGKPAPTWEPVCTVWAEVQEVVARERLRAAQVLGARSATITILFREDLDAAMRVRHAGAVWRIVGLAEVGRRKALQLTVEALEAKP